MKKRYSSHKDYIYIPRLKIAYRFFYVMARFKYSPYEVEFEVEPKPKEEQAIFISNHCQAYGPVIYQMFFRKKYKIPVNGRPRIWSTSELVHHKEARKFFRIVTARRSKRKNLWKFLSTILSSIAVYVFRGAEVIPVYRNEKISITYKKSLETLKEGRDIVILPESPTKKNNFIHYFNIGFADLAKLAYDELNMVLPFYPMYISPDLKKIKVGKPIYYDHTNDKLEERVRIINYLEDAVTKLGESLPKHKVIHFK